LGLAGEPSEEKHQTRKQQKHRDKGEIEMSKLTIKYALIAAIVLLAQAGLAETRDGFFSVLCYNVAGIDPSAFGFSLHANDQTKGGSFQIGKQIRDCGADIVCLQEDWDFHGRIMDGYYAGSNPLPYDYQSSFTGHTTNAGKIAAYWAAGSPGSCRSIAAGGNGLFKLSRFEMSYHNSRRWDHCAGCVVPWSEGGKVDDIKNEGDCMAKKGFDMDRIWLDDGVSIDVYNLHADAGNSLADKYARRYNFIQLLDKIDDWSNQRAVIVMGDTNSKYKDDPGYGSNSMLDAGFLDCREDGGGTVDKIWRRDGGGVYFNTITYDKLDWNHNKGAFDNGELSDHKPILCTLHFYADILPDCSLKSERNNKYVRAVGGGGDAVLADRNDHGSSATRFKIKTRASDPNAIFHGETVWIETGGDHYFQAKSNGGLDADDEELSAENKFTLYNHTDGSGTLEDGDTVSFKSVKYNRYIKVHGDDNVKCDGTGSDGNSTKRFVVNFH